jgi:hypothetical protein
MRRRTPRKRPEGALTAAEVRKGFELLGLATPTQREKFTSFAQGDEDPGSKKKATFIRLRSQSTAEEVVVQG